MSKFFKVAHISDPHLLENSTDILFQVNPFERLLHLLNIIKKNHYDLLIISGDIADNGDIKSYRLLNDLLATLSIPIILIPGNHDNEQHLVNTIAQKSDCWVSPKTPILLGGWTFLHMNNNISEKPQGKVTTAGLKQLQYQLEITSQPICLLIHHPLFSTRIPKIDLYGLINPQDLLPLLAYKVRLVLCGHIHGDYRWFYKGVFFESAPSSAFQFDPPGNSSESACEIRKEGYNINLNIYGFKEYLFSADHYHVRTIWQEHEKII